MGPRDRSNPEGGHRGELEAGFSGALLDRLRSDPPWASAFDWHTFYCVGCGQHTAVGREPWQSVADFAQMCEWLFGDPPICSACLHAS